MLTLISELWPLRCPVCALEVSRGIDRPLTSPNRLSIDYLRIRNTRSYTFTHARFCVLTFCH